MEKTQKKKLACTLTVAMLPGLCFLPFPMAGGGGAREKVVSTTPAYALWADAGASPILSIQKAGSQEGTHLDAAAYPIGSSASIAHMPH